MESRMQFEKGYMTAEAEVQNIYGIHARPSALIVIRASKYSRDIYLTCLKNPENPDNDSDTEYDCKLISSMMSIGAGQGSILKVHVKAEDKNDEQARTICKELSDLISSDLETVILELKKEGKTRDWDS